MLEIENSIQFEKQLSKVQHEAGDDVMLRGERSRIDEMSVILGHGSAQSWTSAPIAPSLTKTRRIQPPHLYWLLTHLPQLTFSLLVTSSKFKAFASCYGSDLTIHSHRAEDPVYLPCNLNISVRCKNVKPMDEPQIYF